MLKRFNEMYPPRSDRYGVVAAAAIRKQQKTSKRTKRSQSPKSRVDRVSQADERIQLPLTERNETHKLNQEQKDEQVERQ
ncbi:hypothetical protein COLO4_00340 [Corchorus olitorius]|uniref:Uncharacterized protein n=1 Tax=Corchorus olitorius TaxID=93759 RepID=A0A1R3L401_9ROSI|nr:hypothetical protein COLO4_00340 [Corchorus olitorius]